MFRPKFSLLLPILLCSIQCQAAKKTCGGTYTAARGVLTTPNFPGPFPVPVRCQWVIDASNTATTNTSIVVYLTQLFTFEGLTFTEYQLYGSDYKINPKVIHRVNETNISRIRWVQTYRNYLVIELKLQNSDSAHLRVLDKFLNVFGFNITYEITNGPVRSNSCTMMDCGFTGICYDHYTKFSCQCFPGYSGSNCSEGEKSFCYSGGSPTCKNGATCLHVGANAIKCHCPKGYAGHTCETPAPLPTKECPTCRVVCPFDGRLEKACKCSKSGRSNGTSVITDRPGFVTTMHLGNLPDVEGKSLKNYIKTQLLTNLQANFSRVEDLEVTNIIHFMSGVDVTFRIYAVKKDEKRIRTLLNKWVDRGFVGNITISERDTSIRTPLSLQSVAINQAGVIRENDEFILSCVARGSPSMTFRWFKDGLFINVTSTSRKWIKLIKDPHVVDQYTALLAVENAQKYDEGEFTCQVEDFNIQQCLSKFVKVGKKPLVKIEPMSLTVRKGQNFTIKCITLEENSGNGGKYTYSWTKNKVLLPVRTEVENYEILYPSGTILQVFNAEKDVSYSCLVQDGPASSEKAVSVSVVDREGVQTCPQETLLHVSWPETAPDTDTLLDCPRGFFGTSTRRCSLRDGRKPSWESPDFSGCTNEVLHEIYEKFEELKLGYTSTSPGKVLRAFLNYATAQSSKLLPGEGARILTLTKDVVTYIQQTRLSNSTVENITTTLFSLLDKILLNKSSFGNPKEARLVQEVLFDELKISGSYLTSKNNSKPLHYSLQTMHIVVGNVGTLGPKLKIPSQYANTGKWVNTDVNISQDKNVQAKKSSVVMAAVIYRNLSNLLPPKEFLRLKDGSELEYSIFSQITTILPLNGDAQLTPLAIDFGHNIDINELNTSKGEQWSISCGYSDQSTFSYTWEIYTCVTKTIDSMKTRCICPKFGSYTLLIASTQPQVTIETNNHQQYILIIGCCVCAICSFFVTICLTTSCLLAKKSCLLVLKLQCSSSVLLTSLIFALAVLHTPSQAYFMMSICALEMFLLLGISSHLSKLLIIFTELIQLPKTVNTKYTIMGIISGVPIITVFGNHLAYRTMDVKLKSWWIIQGTLAFDIFVVVLSIITLLFVYLFVIVMKKLIELKKVHEKYAASINKRIGLLIRSGCVFCVLLAFAISSIIFINNENDLWSIYQFSATNFIMAISLLTSYVLNSEIHLKDMFTNTSKNENENKFFSVDSASSPLNFLTKEDGEMDNQSGSQLKQNFQQFALKANDCPTTKSQGISATLERCLHTSTSFCNNHDEHSISPVVEVNDPPIECYSSSPQSFRKFSTLNAVSHSPDILSSKSCVEFDLVASSIHMPSVRIDQDKNNELRRPICPPKLIITPDDAISKILDSETIQIQPERTQPDGHDEILRANENAQVIEATSADKNQPSCSSDNLDGVLDSISHDLDYLLSDIETAVSNVSTLRRVSKPPGASVKHKIPEELLKEDSESPESVTLRTNC